MKNKFFAQIATGLEKLGAEEVALLGATAIKPVYRGIYFEADKATLYRINYQTRFINRVLSPIMKFPCHSTRYLYKKAKEIKWENYFNLTQTFAIFANVSNSKIRHSQYAALCLKDAIVDYFREKYDNRPNVERITPDVWFNLYIENNWATISIDTSNGSLHRRGYRQESVEAPMQETVAAAIIHFTGWQGEAPLFDPFCGSGTLLAEALMSYCKIPAGYFREKFGFQHLPDFDQKLWRQVKKSADEQIRELPPNLIAGSDISPRAIEIASTNLRNIPFGENIALKVSDFQKLNKLNNRIIVTNPPYGIRLSEKEDVKKLYQNFGDFLKQRCENSTCYIYFGDRKLIPFIRLKPSWRKPLYNGGLDGRLAKFVLYSIGEK